MKNSTVLFVIGILGLGGVGTYLYLKNKKKSVVSSLPTNPTTNPATNPPNTTDTKSETSSEVNSSLGLPLPIDKIVALYNETTTENYKKAKLLSNEIQKDSARVNLYKTRSSRDAVRRDIANKTKQANALGYKILNNGEIEKM
jgi:hypothetical protein